MSALAILGGLTALVGGFINLGSAINKGSYDKQNISLQYKDYWNQLKGMETEYKGAVTDLENQNYFLNDEMVGKDTDGDGTIDTGLNKWFAEYAANRKLALDRQQGIVDSANNALSLYNTTSALALASQISQGEATYRQLANQYADSTVRAAGIGATGSMMFAAEQKRKNLVDFVGEDMTFDEHTEGTVDNGYAGSGLYALTLKNLRGQITQDRMDLHNNLESAKSGYEAEQSDWDTQYVQNTNRLNEIMGWTDADGVYHQGVIDINKESIGNLEDQYDRILKLAEEVRKAAGLDEDGNVIPTPAPTPTPSTNNDRESSSSSSGSSSKKDDYWNHDDNDDRDYVPEPNDHYYMGPDDADDSKGERPDWLDSFLNDSSSSSSGSSNSSGSSGGKTTTESSKDGYTTTTSTRKDDKGVTHTSTVKKYTGNK